MSYELLNNKNNKKLNTKINEIFNLYYNKLFHMNPSDRTKAERM